MKTLVTTDPASPSDSLLVGACCGPWRIEHELGRGGMGIVYAVEHVVIGKRAALKILHQRIAQPERMLIEARVVNAIGHPNIVDIFDVGTAPDGRPYIVMERLDGAPLAEVHVDKRGAIEILIEVCAALDAAHAAGVVHRDLKPDNIFVGYHRVTLLDWGIARLLHANVHASAERHLLGTPQYVSPEQARGLDVTPAADVYALGVVAYELLLGEPPFDAASAAQVMAMHIYMPPKRPVLGDPALESLLCDMLAKSPSARPTMAQVAERLRACLEVAPLAIPEVEDFADEPVELPRRRRWPLIAGSVALASSAAVFELRDAQMIDSAPAANITRLESSAEAAAPAIMQGRRAADASNIFFSCQPSK